MLKFVPDWFVTKTKLIINKKTYTALFAEDNILFFDKNFSNVTFATDKTGILCIKFNNIYLNDANFYDYDLKTIICVIT